MKRRLAKGARFAWRTARNLLCALPGGQRMLFPPEKLANRFGRGDADYALEVYRHHALQLHPCGFDGAARILEAGPGRNLGTALLWWARAVSECNTGVLVVLWDVHANAHPEVAGYWAGLARSLLIANGAAGAIDSSLTLSQCAILEAVAVGDLIPAIRYQICSLERLPEALGPASFDLVFSHAALEHVRKIEEFWYLAAKLTAPSGWHSHRIDLADHGRREGNYLEMLEWSSLAWWISMRFVPGALNRRRACDHEALLTRHGLQILSVVREQRDSLPVPRAYLAKPYRDLSEVELRTTAVDIVARAGASHCVS